MVLWFRHKTHKFSCKIYRNKQRRRHVVTRPFLSLDHWYRHLVSHHHFSTKNLPHLKSVRRGSRPWGCRRNLRKQVSRMNPSLGRKKGRHFVRNFPFQNGLRYSSPTQGSSSKTPRRTFGTSRLLKPVGQCLSCQTLPFLRSRRRRTYVSRMCGNRQSGEEGPVHR